MGQQLGLGPPTRDWCCKERYELQFVKERKDRSQKLILMIMATMIILRQSTVIMGEGNGATNLALKNSTTTLQIAQEMMIN